MTRPEGRTRIAVRDLLIRAAGTGGSAPTR